MSDDFNYDNEIIELESDSSDEEVEVLDTLEEEGKEKKKKKKKKSRRSLKDWWSDLSKGGKLGIILGIGLLLLLIAGLIIYFVIFRKDEEKEEPEDTVIVEKDNYRYENGKLIFLDIYDKEIGSYECSEKDSEKCFVAKPDYSNDEMERIISVNELGEEIIKNSQIYSNNYVFINDNNKEFLYDIKKNESILDVTNFKTYSTNKDVVVIEDESNKYGLIEINNNGFDYLIRPSYDNLGIINGNLIYLVAKDKTDNYIIDSTGKKISEVIPGTIKSANSDYIVSLNSNKYDLYAYDKSKLLESYDYIGLHENVISLVKSSRLYLLDNNLSKLNEEGIRLTSTNYVKKYVYDENKNLKETKVAYEISMGDNAILINLGNETKSLNLYEGIVSSGISYLSYFDGTLYFYKDDEKLDLLSTYKCNNKNEINSSTSTFNKCNLYQKDGKYTGIYNNQYVFIYDNISDTDAKIYLYDLKTKKVKGTYSSLELTNSVELNDDVRQLETTSSYFIAKSAVGNNTGNYGVIEINSNTVKGKIEFKYKDIKYSNKYYLLATDDSYVVYDDTFKKISNEFDYIDLYDDYYVGIKNNSLNVYKYSSALGILSYDLDVSDNKYEIEFDDKGFIITINNSEHKYDKDGYTRYD